MIKLITFDATGTLLKFRTPPIDIYREASVRYGLCLSREDIQINFKKTWKTMNKQKLHFGTNWKEWWTEFVFKTLKTSNKDVAVDLLSYFSSGKAYQWNKGALETLTGLSKLNDNLHLGIISNSDPRLRKILQTVSEESESVLFKGIIDAVNQQEFFNPLILSHECQSSKPSREIFDLARSIVNAEANECVHIGDNEILDYQAAKNAGWSAIHFKGAFKPLIDLVS